MMWPVDGAVDIRSQVSASVGTISARVEHGMPEEVRDEETMWHLYWEAAAGREFFPRNTFCGQLQAHIVRAFKRPRCALVTYLLLPREIHLVVRLAPGVTAGAVARAIGSVIARRVNRAARVRSPAFSCRCRAMRILSTAAFRDEMRLLAWRAVLLGHARTPLIYPHSSFPVCLGLATQEGYDTRAVLRLFAGSVVKARRAIRGLIADRPSDEEQHAWAASRALGVVTGRRANAATNRAGRARSADADALRAADSDTAEGAVEFLEKWAAMKMGVSSGAVLITSTSRAAARGRGLVACIATSFGLCTAAFLLKRYGLSKSTLSEQMQRWRKKKGKPNRKGEDEDETARVLLSTPVNQIISEVSQIRGR